MRRKDFDLLIDGGQFAELFISEMGWNNPDNSQPLYINIDEQDYDFIPVADKQGFHVYSCELDVIPTASDCKKIDNKLRNYGYDYICIFIQRGTKHHLWLTPVKTNEKRELVKTEYIGGAKADFLFSKMDDLSFGLTEHVLISDVKQKVQGSFHLNSEKVTKDFYTQFRKEHKAFTKFITGIDNDKDKDWYASVMLNRLMFCYFIQKKGFLDLKTNYLQEKLKWVRDMKGEDRFFDTFYQGFLCALFHDGLNNPRHSADFKQKYGRIPYLNGGMFDEHQLERENRGIDIADEAFKNLFDFFDKWNWHLDTRLTASGKDINPDVLGYIFEQYINDRAAMGAYYTKEDITEYIGKNCIIPFLMDKTANATKDAAKAFAPDGFVWQMLRESDDRYIYDAVKKGYSSDWQQRMPDYISQGIDTTSGNLLERRSRWNEKTHEEFALPTEIWRETVERLQRCDKLFAWISNPTSLSGDKRGASINDFITYNLDIRQFAEDVIRQTQDHRFVAHFYHALQNVTILDPTCGSGAFLFAALNILEPLYEACLDRMEEFNRQNSNLFVQELEEINAKYSSNRQYFIYKSIILRNLYGVDIMVEATEIAKLRLFLKMVAVVEVDKRKDNLGLDPLPDIDFNIKCGNTLVGYATEKELDEALTFGGDMFANLEFKDKISNEMSVVARAYECFRSEQLKAYDDNASIKATKEMLKERLTTLNDLLNHHMHKVNTAGGNYDKWLKDTQPFHWLAEFYQIIHGNGGFDVIIGNPPYVNMKDIHYLQPTTNYKCSDLYGYVIRRTFELQHTKSTHGFVVMHNLAFSSNFADVRSLLKKKCGDLWCSFYSRIPSGLFSGDCRVRCTIYVCNNVNNNKKLYTTRLHRWFTESRDSLLKTLVFCNSTNYFTDVIPMSENEELLALYNNKRGTSIKLLKQRGSQYSVYFKQTAYNWLPVSLSPAPIYEKGKLLKEISGTGEFRVENKEMQEILLLLLNGKFYFLRWITYGDDFHVTSEDLTDFVFPFDKVSSEDLASLHRLATQFISEMPNHIQYKLNAGKDIGNYNTSKLWHITEQSDKILLKYITTDVLNIQNAIDNLIAKVVITDKK